MSKSDVEIQINGGEVGPYEMPLFRPEETVKGSVSIFPSKNIKCRSVVIQLTWHTEGRGTKFEEVIEEMNVFEGELERSVPLYYDFNFRLPSDPWSYSGRYVSVVWGISVKIDVPLMRDISETKPFLLLPNRGEVSGF